MKRNSFIYTNTELNSYTEKELTGKGKKADSWDVICVLFVSDTSFSYLQMENMKVIIDKWQKDESFVE